MLNVVDDICILFITQDFQNVRAITNVLRDDIFLLFNEKIGIENWIICYLINGCKSKRKLRKKQTRQK